MCGIRVRAKRSRSSARYVSAEKRSKVSNSPLVGNRNTSQVPFTQGIENQVNGIVSTWISTSTITVIFIIGTVVRGRTLGVRVDVGSVETEVDSVVEALGKLGTSTSDMGSYLDGSTSVEEGGLERLDVMIYHLVGLDGRIIDSSLPVIQELF
jgi:hypothetical protein